MFMNVEFSRLHPGKGALSARSRPGPSGCSPPSQAGRPSRPPAPPLPAPSETNAAHGGLYGARRQRVARLTLRGKFGGGRQGALMRGPPAAAAARGGGGCRKREPALRLPPPRIPNPSPPPPPPRHPAGGSTLQLRPALYYPNCYSFPGALLLCASTVRLCKMGPTLLGWAGGLNELIRCTGGQHVGSPGQRGSHKLRLMFRRRRHIRLSGLFPTTCGENCAGIAVGQSGVTGPRAAAMARLDSA